MIARRLRRRGALALGSPRTQRRKLRKHHKKKINKKEKPFVMELSSPADSPASVRAPTFDISAVSFSFFSDDNGVIVKDAFRRKVS